LEFIQNRKKYLQQRYKKSAWKTGHLLKRTYHCRIIPLCDRGIYYIILSRVRRSVTNNNGFWIGLLDLLTPIHSHSSELYVSFVVAWRGPHRKYRFLYCCKGMLTAPLPSNRSPIIPCTSVTGMRLATRCLTMDIHVTTLMYRLCENTVISQTTQYRTVGSLMND
jgi:hypothetical protein